MLLKPERHFMLIGDVAQSQLTHTHSTILRPAGRALTRAAVISGWRRRLVAFGPHFQEVSSVSGISGVISGVTDGYRGSRRLLNLRRVCH